MRQIFRRGPQVVLTMETVDQLTARLQNDVMRQVRHELTDLRQRIEQERRDRDMFAADVDRQISSLSIELGRLRQVVAAMHDPGTEKHQWE